MVNKDNEMLWRGTLGLISLLCRVKLTESIGWPAGTYGLPKAVSGCPLADDFQWKEGWVSQDRDDHYTKKPKSPEFHLDGEVDYSKVKRSFCVKTDISDDKNRSAWPVGKYCVYKKDGQCPRGLKTGHVYWDDDDTSISNSKGGTLPDGDYGLNTKIWFCCRTDGNKNDPVLLPSKAPFFLLAYESATCQMVKWAIASLEWIYYDTEHTINRDSAAGAYPYKAGEKHPTIYYCYYRGCNKTLNGVNGTLNSPNYPRKYPDGQYCSWRITVNPLQHIHLTFTNFSLQSENNTDGLYVYDGENATGEVLGVFYGGHPPPKKGIYSSSNQMFVIFKSDNSGSYTGFSASYSAVNFSATTAAMTTARIPEVTSLSTAHTLKKTTASGELMPTTNAPSKERGNKKQRGQSERKGLNVVAVVVPVIVLVLLVPLLVAAFLYRKRRRTKQEKQEMTKKVVYLRSNGETPMSLENPYYDRASGETLMSVDNVLYDSELIIENTACPSEANDLYTEVEEHEETYLTKENENPLYETAGRDAVLNPIYASSI